MRQIPQALILLIAFMPQDNPHFMDIDAGGASVAGEAAIPVLRRYRAARQN